MLNDEFKKVKVLIYEPGKSGHRSIILRYIAEILEQNDIYFFIVDYPIVAKNLLGELVEISYKNECNIIHVLTMDGLSLSLLKYSFQKKLLSPKIIGNYYLYNNLYEIPQSFVWNYLFSKGAIDKLLISDEFIDRRNYTSWKKKFLGYLPDPWRVEDFHLYSKEIARKYLDIANETTIFLMFGEISFRKGINFFIDALLSLHQENLAPFVGLVTGTISEEIKKSDVYTKMLLLVKESKLILQNEFIPESLVSTYFCASDVVVCPYPKSFKVSSGTFTRACAAGRPSIVPSHSNLARIVEILNSGCIFESESIASLTSTMKKVMLSDSLKSKDLSSILQSYARERTTNQYGHCLIQAYEDLVL